MTCTITRNLPRSDSLQKAIEQWRTVLGPDAVRSDVPTIDRYARTTSPRGTVPAAVLYPTTTELVQQVVRIAFRFDVPLYPISRGRNWGYGDACAAGDGQVIVDLGRMTRILEVNARLAYAVIEPGVTQQQLYEHLIQHETGLWMDATGAGLEASVLGNTLERGFGHTPCGDHFANTCGLQIVLADGQVLETGFGHFAHAPATHCYPYGIGPVLDGLFSQSNLGIVTRIGIWLNRRPQAMEAFFVSAPDPGDLPDLIDRLLPLRLDGLLRSAVHVANDLRVVSLRIRHPSAGSAQVAPLSTAQRAALRRKLGIGAWNISGAIYGTRATVRATRQALKQALRPHRVITLNDARLGLARRASGVLERFGLGFGRRLAEMLAIVEPAYELLKGTPSDAFLPGVLWHLDTPDPDNSLDPLDREAGLIWVSPVVPAEGSHVEPLTRLMETIYHRHGFDFPVTFSFVTNRALCAVTNLSFDRRDRSQIDRAAMCYDELMHALLEAGYPPYRTGPAGFEKIRTDTVFWHTCRQIKKTLDPKCLISPGRYIG